MANTLAEAMQEAERDERMEGTRGGSLYFECEVPSIEPQSFVRPATEAESVAFRAAMAEYDRKSAFWATHREEYARDYPDQFVAVKDGEVVASDAHILGLEQKLNAVGLRLESDVTFQFIAVTPRILIL